ncbi:MAG TPA: ABC transporter permease [Aliidongia sp.]|uniref:ABC transporter permease n=1 Tax=Aliidongia sp. TaxID=1914230 RepID=UPI002DDD7FC9|nr:ABC transporter permease [Aliidongia sp.]HEV2676294.1 ABC transporter permease [Aliidongia sp.]
MSLFKQIGAVTAMNLQNVPSRLGTSLVIVVGIAGVVGVLISVLAMALGFSAALDHTGRADRAIVMRGGSTSELGSTISRENALTILDAPGVRKTADGKPVGSADELVIVGLPQKGSATGVNVTLRGIGPEGLATHPEIRLIAGRMFQPAVREVVVGKSAAAQFQGLEVGSHIAFRDSDWTVVGMFESGGDAHESEMLADAETVMSAYRRNLFESVTVLLDDAAAFDGFKAALTTNPTLSVDVEREPAYYAAMSATLQKMLFFIAYVVGGIMAVGALFGALNTMYSAVSTRAVEIATLRALGFGAAPVVISVFVEALLLSFVGGAIGAALAWFFFNGNAANTLSGNFTQLVFHLTIGPGIILLGIAWACAIGMVGSLFPAIRAARLPIAVVLRAG